MIIGVLQIDLFISGAQSLKEKRMILRSLKTRLRKNFNVAVSELDHHDKWQRSSVGIVSVGNTKNMLDSMLAGIVDFVNREKRVDLIDYSTELL